MPTAGRREAGPDRQLSSPGDTPDEESRARDLCLRQLTAAPRTAAQLTAAMARRGFDERIASRVLHRLTEVGLVDDAAFAEAWVGSRHAGRGLARRALGHELRDRGVADPLVASALDGLDPEREVATARDLATRKLAATRGMDATTRFRRTASALARKGYSPELSYRVIREVLESEGGSGGAELDATALDLDG